MARNRQWGTYVAAALVLALGAGGLLPTPGLGGPTLFQEDFDGLTLGPPVHENSADTTAFTHTPPVGWTLDNSTMGTGGVEEWRGWSFADPVFWDAVAGQGRSQFTKGQNVIAVSDGDEWSDRTPRTGTFNSFLTTPAIPVAGQPSTLLLTFDSSWRREAAQTATVEVSYDGGPKTEVLRWETANKPDATNETVAIPLAVPAGASNMALTFGYTKAGNNWWWAFDNVEVSSPQDPALASKLAAYLPFDQTSAPGVYPDVTGNGNHASVAAGSPTQVASKPGLGDAIFINKAASDAAGGTGPIDTTIKEYLTLADGGNLDFSDTESFSMTYWFMVPRDQRGDPSFLSNKDWMSGGNQGWNISMNDSGNGDDHGANLGDGPGGGGRADPGPRDLQFNQWTFGALVVDRNADQAILYTGFQNGSLDPRTDSIVGLLDMSTPAGFAINIGQDGTGNYPWNHVGLIDELAFWQDALTREQIDALYSGGLSGIPLSTFLPEEDLIPEPTTLALLAFGGLGLLARRRPRR